MSERHYKRELQKLMKNNSYVLIRQRNHFVWKHEFYGNQIVTPVTTRNSWRTLKNVKSQIKRDTPRMEHS